jgi:succinoglycan biosynthesis transport protein ExoP
MQNNNSDGNQNLTRQNAVSPLERIELVSGFTDFGMPCGPQKHLREYVRLLMKRKWIIIGCVVTAVVIAAVYNFRQTPIYQATAQLEIDMESNDVLPYQDFNNSQFNYYEYEEFLQTQIKHITSRNLAERIAQVAGLNQEVPVEPREEEEKSVLSLLWSWITGSQTPEEESKPLTRDQIMEMAIGEVQGGLFVNPIMDSRVVEIGFSSPDPEKATRIVNAAIDEYIDYNFEAKFDATSRATEFLQKQLTDLKAQVEESEKDLIEYAREKNILDINEKQDVVIQRLADINSQLSVASADRMVKESIYKTMTNAAADSFPQALRTPLMEQLEPQLLADEQKLAEMTAQLGPAMPQVRMLQSRVEQARAQLESEKNRSIENARTEYETALAREKLLSDAFDKQKVIANNLNESSIHYNILRREVDTSKQLYDGLLQRMKEATVAAGLKSSNIRVVDEAETPEFPVSPNMRKNLALGLMLGLMFGFGLAFFLNYLDNTIKTPEDVEEKIGLPALGLIPSLESARSRYGYLPSSRKKKAYSEALVQQGVELASLMAGSSIIAEAYRGLRTSLFFSTPDNPPKIIMITSAKAQEGKTTTVCNTALSLAQIGKKVLILDCDMRRPKIKNIFKEEGSGLSEYLTGQVEFQDIIRQSTIPNLFITHSGTPPPNPGELLGSERLKDAINFSTSG